jgi:hypothetical protein
VIVEVASGEKPGAYGFEIPVAYLVDENPIVLGTRGRVAFHADFIGPHRAADRQHVGSADGTDARQRAQAIAQFAIHRYPSFLGILRVAEIDGHQEAMVPAKTGVERFEIAEGSQQQSRAGDQHER